MQRAFNFNAGPAALPEEVLRTAASEMLDYRGTGLSVMEMSHRSPAFKRVIETAEADLRDLLAVPDDYDVLFLQGGGTQQFAMVPMNLMHSGVADYIVTGAWSKKAFNEAKLYGAPHVVATGEGSSFTRIPDCSDLAVSPEADYVYFCQNETIGGVQFHTLPNAKGKTLVADASSCFLSEPMDVSRYGLVWAGAQKNVGPAGTVIVIVRKDLVTEDVWPGTPTMLRYKTSADSGSLYNTPPCWGIYICGLVFKWIKGQGGLAGMAERNRRKAELLYSVIDASPLYKGYADPADRSFMNVTFTTGDAQGDAAFIDAATKAGFVGVKGHRSFGGMRASIYNAVPVEAVEALANFMVSYERGLAGRSSSSSSCSCSSSEESASGSQSM